MKTLEINSQEYILDSDIEKGFLKGSLWGNLFSGYKFILTDVKDLTEEEQILFMLQVYTFASIELTLYVCTHPDNKDAIETLKKVNIEKDKLCSYIETRYGALKACSVLFDGFLNRKCTWEVKK
ncbi:MAG: spore coat protein CotJB [Roseburia sp.]|nr:spore coat protein CotJB [Anaeroplasma bactoclasticum]MCM1197170.1 spore coat protein CotJB [Roseburia sp.]MCM1557741.1 spore coat protein CotJB [Anaeroplasma bactoclasticum]